jgi:hypothetical protein
MTSNIQDIKRAKLHSLVTSNLSVTHTRLACPVHSYYLVEGSNSLIASFVLQRFRSIYFSRHNVPFSKSGMSSARKGWRQHGHRQWERSLRSHRLMQELWKTCLHSGLNAQTTESPTWYELIQMAQLVEISRLSPSGRWNPDLSPISIETRPHANVSEAERSILLSSLSSTLVVGTVVVATRSGVSLLLTSPLLVVLSLIVVAPSLQFALWQKFFSSSTWTQDTPQVLVNGSKGCWWVRKYSQSNFVGYREQSFLLLIP